MVISSLNLYSKGISVSNFNQVLTLLIKLVLLTLFYTLWGSGISNLYPISAVLISQTLYL